MGPHSLLPLADARRGVDHAALPPAPVCESTGAGDGQTRSFCESGRSRADLYLQRQRDVLEQMVQGAPLEEILETLVLTVEQLAERRLVATVLLMEPDGEHLRSAAGGHCPSEWSAYLARVKIGPAVGSCGTAAFHGERVSVTDIATDPRWAAYKDEAARHGFRACWSSPIKASTGKVLGTFAIYYYEPSGPTPGEIELVDVVTRSAALAIERRAADRALRESETRFRAMIDQAAVGVVEVETTGRIVRCNHCFCGLLGYTEAEMLGRMVVDIVHPDDRPATLANLKNLLAGGSDFVREKRYLHKNGSLIWAINNVSALRDPTGAVQQIVAMVTDVTDRKRAEETLRERERELRLISAHVPAVLSHWDREHRLVFASRAFAERWNATPEALIGRTMEEISGPEAFAAVQPHLTRALAGERVELEMEVPQGNLGLRYVRASYAPEIGEDGRVRGYLAAVTDLTDRRRTEVALRESEERLRMATRTGKVGLWEWDIESNRMIWTDSLYEIHGVSPREFSATAEGFAGLIHPDDRDSTQRAIKNALERDVPYEVEFRVVRPDGGIVWVFTNAVVMREKGRAIRMLGATLDVTARKSAEFALRESEARFRALVNHAPVGIFLTDAAGGTIFVNEAWTTMVGVSADQAQGRGWLNAIHRDDRARVTAEWEKAVRTGRSTNAEYRFVHADGRITWVQGNAEQLRDANGQPSGYIGTIVDVTQRKVVEEKLRAREAQLRLITNNAPIILAHCDVAQRFLFVNRAYAERFGLRPEDIVGRTVLDVLGPAAHGALAPYVARVLAGEAVDFEVEVPYRGLGHRVMRSSYVPDVGADGVVRGWLSAISDVTDEKRTEEALRRVAAIVESSDDAIVSKNLKGVIQSWNEGAERMFGYTAAEAIGRSITLIIPAELQDEEPAIVARIQRGERIEHFETVRQRKDGTLLNISLTISPIRNAEGRVVGASKIARDITARKRDEAELQRRAVTLQVLNRVGTTLAVERDIGQVVQNITDAGREVTGAAFGAFLSRAADAGDDTVTLLAVSGVAREAFEKFFLARATALFGPGFCVRGVVSVGDGQGENDRPGRAPAGGLPLARSQLAVPVVSRSGEVIGGLFYAHPARDYFFEEGGRTLTAIASQAAIAIDNANLYKALSSELEQKSRAEAELRAAQEQLRDHANELEEKVEARTASLREAIVQMEEFSYSVSHDLRAPLRAMNAYAQALVEDHSEHLDATAKNYLERIQRSSERMEKLTHDVLTYSRVARAEVNLTVLDLDKLIGDIISHYAQLQPPAADVEVVRPVHRVLGNETSLGQCLANLLTNAAKFVEPGVQPRIRVRSELRGDFVRVWIEDNGIGIAPEYQHALFRVFERVPTNHAYEGTGIGLAIVRKAVEKMGGHCGVESNGLKGSRFWIELPKA